MYSIAFHPLFILRQLMFLMSFRKRDWQFLFTYSIRAIRRVKQHIFNLTQHEGKALPDDEMNLTKAIKK